MLAAATAAAEKGDWSETQRVLLKLWAQRRWVDLIERMERIDACQHPLGYGGPGKEVVRQMIADLRAKDPLLLARVQAQLGNLTRAEVTKVLAEVQKLPRDPRWGRFLAGWIAAPPFLSGRALWVAVLETASYCQDPRPHPGLMEGPQGLAFDFFYNIRPVWERCRTVALQSPSRTCDDPEGLAALDAAIATQETRHAEASQLETDLWTRVRTDPWDLEAVAVLADLWSQRGDPRGELAALQLAGGHAPAAKKLQKKYWRAWLGNVGVAAKATNLRFEHGLLDRVSVSFKTLQQARDTLGNREWSTVRDIEVTAQGDVGFAELWRTLIPALPNLRIARGVADTYTLVELLDRVPDIEEIHAGQGVRGNATQLPRARTLQRYFGPIHDLGMLTDLMGRVGLRIWQVDLDAFPIMEPSERVIADLEAQMARLARLGVEQVTVQLHRPRRVLSCRAPKED